MREGGEAMTDNRTTELEQSKLEQTIATTLGSDPPYDELLRCLENDWNISASWDGLRKFWCVELTDEGVRLRDGMQNARAERTCKMRQHMWMPIWTCSVCGASNGGLFGLGKYEPPKICPNCGCKAVGE